MARSFVGCMKNVEIARTNFDLLRESYGVKKGCVLKVQPHALGEVIIVMMILKEVLFRWCVCAARPQRVGVRRRVSADACAPLCSSHGGHEQLLQQTRARRDPGGVQLAPSHAAGGFRLHSVTAVSVNTSHLLLLLSALSPSCW